MRLFKLTHYPRLDRAHLDPARMLYSIVSSVQRRAPASLLVPRRACRGVAQPGRAPGSGPGGRRFKSSLPDQYFQGVISDPWFFVHSRGDDFVDVLTFDVLSSV